MAADAAVARNASRERSGPRAEFVGEPAPGRGPGHAMGRDLREVELAEAIEADRRLARLPLTQSVVVGSVQILALLAGISRDGATMVAGWRGPVREDAARFAFLLATTVILAAGALKILDLLGRLGNGDRGQTLPGSVRPGVGACPSVRCLLRYCALDPHTFGSTA